MSVSTSSATFAISYHIVLCHSTLKGLLVTRRGIGCLWPPLLGYRPGRGGRAGPTHFSPKALEARSNKASSAPSQFEWNSKRRRKRNKNIQHSQPPSSRRPTYLTGGHLGTFGRVQSTRLSRRDPSGGQGGHTRRLWRGQRTPRVKWNGTGRVGWPRTMRWNSPARPLEGLHG